MIEIPTDDAGKFEAVDEAGTVVGCGTVVRNDAADDVVVFWHDGLPGAPAQRVELPLVEFASTWEALPQSNHIELRAAET
jgi:hypothetical protein